MSAKLPLIRVAVVSLAIGIGAKLVLLAAATITLGFEPARPLRFPGTGVLLAALAFPLLRRRILAR
jgi:hypothetical protein